MKISTKGRYALRFMLDLAMYREQGFVSLGDAAKRQNISKKYLEQIVPMLNKAGVLRTTRGYQGGYMLCRNPDEYTVGEILRITEGSLAPVSCVGQGSEICDKQSECITFPLWQGLDRVINQYLDSVTLQDLLDKHNANNDNFDYCI